jgi:hypothetical protein
MKTKSAIQKAILCAIHQFDLEMFANPSIVGR